MTTVNFVFIEICTRTVQKSLGDPEKKNVFKRLAKVNKIICKRYAVIIRCHASMSFIDAIAG